MLIRQLILRMARAIAYWLTKPCLWCNEGKRLPKIVGYCGTSPMIEVCPDCDGYGRIFRLFKDIPYPFDKGVHGIDVSGKDQEACRGRLAST